MRHFSLYLPVCNLSEMMIELLPPSLNVMVNFLPRNAPAQSADQAGLWEFKPVVKSSRMKVGGRRWCVSYAKNWASKHQGTNMLPAISEKFRGGLSIFMPGTYPTSTGRRAGT